MVNMALILLAVRLPIAIFMLSINIMISPFNYFGSIPAETVLKDFTIFNLNYPAGISGYFISH